MLVAVVTMTGWAAAPNARPDKQKLKAREGDLRPGDPAPDFTLQDVEGKISVQLSKLKGKPVVLFFGSCT